MNAGAKNLMKMKKKTFKDLSLKVRDILFFNAHCFEKMMKAGGENSFDYKAFFEIISKEELLSDLKRYQILKGAFLSANKAYQAYKAQTKLFDLDEVDFVNYRGWQVEIPKEGKDPKIKKINKRHLMDKVKSAGVLTEYSHVKWINTLDLSKMKKF